MTHSLIKRSRHLRIQARETKKLAPASAERRANTTLELREALLLLEEFETALETVTKEFVGLEARAFEIAGLLVRGPHGHDWLKSFPDNKTATEVRQKLLALVKWAAERSKQFNSNTNGSGL